MKEYRCRNNQSQLLCKAKGLGHIHIMNPWTRIENYFGPSRESFDKGPKGIDFTQYGVSLKCSNKSCKRELGKAIGFMQIEIKCKHCKHITTFDTEKMQAVRLNPLPRVVRQRIEKKIKDLTTNSKVR